MNYTNKSRFRDLLIAILALWSMAFAACASPWDVGLNAISSDGRWATVVEPGGNPETWRLVLLDLEEEESILLSDNAGAKPESSFAPDGHHILFRTLGGWMLTDRTTDWQAVAAAADHELQFLPNGEILVISSDDEGLTQFSIATHLAHPRKQTLIVDKIRHSFRDQYPDLGVDPMVIKLMKGLAQSAPPTCASMPASNRALWTTVNVHGAVSTLIATPTELSVKHLTPSLSIGVITLLDQQAARIEKVLAPQRQELLEQIQKEAADAGQALSAEELDRRVDTEFEKRVFATLGTSLLGRLSPDGTKLFFLRVVPHKNTETPFSLLTGLHTLYLIDLTTGEEPQVLSDETRWLPSFAFSPDGEQIIFESNRDGGRRLYLANSDGTKIRRLAVEGALNPCWY